MEILQEIIRGVAVIIIFAGFMEMLLPDTEMRRYIQVIVGLFVIVSLTTPLARLITEEKDFEVSAWQYISPDNTKELIEKGSKIAEDQKQQIKSEADKRVAAQIHALAKLHSGVENAEVEIVNNYMEKGIKVKVKLITEESVTAEEKSKLSEQVANTITAFFDYPAESIEISF